MANLSRLRSTAEVLGGNIIGPYGPHLRYEVDRPSGTFVLKHGTSRVAVVSHTAAAVTLAALNPTLLPYVNKAIAHTGRTVIRDRETNEYRFKDDPGPVTSPPAPV